MLRLVGVIDPIFPCIKNHLIEWLSVGLLFVFGISMIVQGYFIYKGKRGYRHYQRIQRKMEDVRKRLEELVFTDHE